MRGGKEEKMEKFFSFCSVFVFGVALGVAVGRQFQVAAVSFHEEAAVATPTTPEPSLTAVEWCDKHLLHPRSAMADCVERRRAGLLKLSTER